MSKIAIVTDSNSGITQKEGKELGISVIPMPFYINEELYRVMLTEEELLGALTVYSFNLLRGKVLERVNTAKILSLTSKMAA